MYNYISHVRYILYITTCMRSYYTNTPICTVSVFCTVHKHCTVTTNSTSIILMHVTYMTDSLTLIHRTTRIHIILNITYQVSYQLSQNSELVKRVYITRAFIKYSKILILPLYFFN